jgi:hypothetical protein
MIPIRVLLTSIVDYAGLFPPAGLAMEQAVRNYASYRASPHAWMLARFIVPVGRLDEFESVAGDLLPRTPNAEAWPISALVGESLDAEIDAIFAFNQRHAESPEHGLAVIDTIELRADGPRAVDRALNIIPQQLTPFFEIPQGDDVRGLIAALAGTGARAKIRCGGVTPSQLPNTERLAAFITNCAAADVPFKATAGLHHPLRAEHNLTYEEDSPRATMHGFLNVFLAAAMVRRAEMSCEDALTLLEDTDPGAFVFTDHHIAWRDHTIDAPRLASARESFAISFGSCSFEEPVNELKALKALA